MNIAKIMIPKANTVLLMANNSVRQGLEKMKFHGYTAVPVVDERGGYCGCVSEGDFLRHLQATGTLDLKQQERYLIKDILRQEFCPPLRIMANEDEVFELALWQNFVPIVDDRNCFCGIVTRQGLMRYLAEQLEEARSYAAVSTVAMETIG